MFRKTRLKFVAISMTGLLIVLALIFGGVNVIISIIINERSRELISSVVSMENEKYIYNSGSPWDDLFGFGNIRNRQKEQISVNYITIYLDDSVLTYDTNIREIDSDVVGIMIENAIKPGKMNGKLGNFCYSFEESNVGKLLVFVNVKELYEIKATLFDVSVAVILISSLIELIFVCIMSNWAIKPLKNAFDKQKRFISDASHELKTPLAVISANCDVLEDDGQNTQWINNIKDSTVRMNKLVYSLLDLSRLDEKGESLILSDFNLSTVLTNTALEFECVAFEKGKELTTQIRDNVMLRGNEQAIKQLFVILIDNAVKHSDSPGKINISLNVHGNKRIIKFYNTGSGIDEKFKEKIFDRFSRSDDARSRDLGGYGLGLAIAKTICEAHKGSISVESEYGKWTCFTVVL